MSHQFGNHVVGFHMTRLMYIVCLFWLCFRTGCLLGLSEAIVSMCRDGKPESRAHVSSILEKLTGVLENTDISDPDYQVSSIRSILLIICFIFQKNYKFMKINCLENVYYSTIHCSCLGKFRSNSIYSAFVALQPNMCSCGSRISEEGVQM